MEWTTQRFMIMHVNLVKSNASPHT